MILFPPGTLHFLYFRTTYTIVSNESRIIMQEILLASSSYLRRVIMDASKLPYKSAAADIDESIFDDLPVEQRVSALAQKKCETIAKDHPNRIIIAADTLTADQDGNIFSKKTHQSDPLLEALKLSGKTIYSVTGCFFYSPEHQAHIVTRTRIVYQQFSKSNLLRLVANDDAAMRSGALGMFTDAPGFTLMEELEGSYTGALGLPMSFIYEQLEKIGYFNQ